MNNKLFTLTAAILGFPSRRIRELRADDRGNVMLLSGMMAFVATIFGLIALDTSKAICNRIVVQNSADAAADAAALWQARGCNVLQHLNNLHYDGNVLAAIAESTSLAACVAAAALDIFFGAGQALCPVCDLAPGIDDLQEQFANAIMFAQDKVATGTPMAAYIAANDAAQGSGADDLILSGSDYLNNALNLFHIPLTIPSDIAGTISRGLGAVGATVYAFPLDKDSLSLAVRTEEGNALPWEYPGPIGEILFNAAIFTGKAVCGLSDPSGGFNAWGWDDSFYVGNPGYMTWIVGKTNQTELAGLGKLRWFNGGAKSNDNEIDYYLSQKNLKRYFGPALDDSKPLELPACIGLASSQVEGDPVISRGDANAKGKLIQLFFPPNDKKGSDLFIFH